MPRGDVRWALANALTVVADASMINEIKALVRDDCYQDMKERLETALKNLGAG
jgi:ABC-type phosphate/phosphonate transport system substrate-binding protein